MDRPHFSAQLLARRRALGLSTKQVASVLRMREDVIVAFEEGDFERMPKSGYARGMLSSYARYLGLDPQQISSEYSRELRDFERRERTRSRGVGDGMSDRNVRRRVSAERRRHTHASGSASTKPGRTKRSASGFSTTSEAMPRSVSLGSPSGLSVTPLGSAYHPAGMQQVARSNHEAAASTSQRRARKGTSSRTKRRQGSRGSTSRSMRSRLAQRGLVGIVEDFFSDRRRALIFCGGTLALVLVCTLVIQIRNFIVARQEEKASVAISAAKEAQDEEAQKEAQADADELRARQEAAAAKAAESQKASGTRTLHVKVESGETSWLEVTCDEVSDVAETITGPWERSYEVHKSIQINVSEPSAVSVSEGGKKLEFEARASGIGSISLTLPQSADTGTEKGSATASQGTGSQGTQAGTTGTEKASGNNGQSATGQGQDVSTQPQQQTDTSQSQQDASTAEQTGSDDQQSGDVSKEVELDLPDGTWSDDGFYYAADGYYDTEGNFYSY
jgi:hypothetical protein